MHKNLRTCLMALLFSTCTLAATKQFVIKLKGNTLYKESIVRSPKKTTQNLIHKETNGVKSEVTPAPANINPTDTIDPPKENNTIGIADRSGYITLQSHCLDEDSLNPLDSVVMDVYSNGTHITAGISDKSGFITTDSIPPGNYYAVVYRNNYSPVSIFFSRTSLNSQSYLDIPLKKKEKYLYESVGQRIWKHLFSLEIIPILFVVFLITFLFKEVIRYAI